MTASLNALHTRQHLPGAARIPGGEPSVGWQRLAELSADLLGVRDEATVLHLAMAAVVDVVRCDTAEVTMRSLPGREGLVVAVHDVTAPGAWAWSLEFDLTDSADLVGTLRIGWRGSLRKHRGQRLAGAFARLLSCSLSAVRSLDAERSAVEASYQRLMLDGLTSLGSRSLLVERGARTLQLADLQGRTAALLLFVVAGVTQVGDTAGHHAGDRVLAEVGLRLRRGVRDGALAVRLGGGEFAVLTGPLGVAEDAERLAARLQHELALPIVVDDVELTVRSSMGIAMYGPDGDSVRELLRSADLATHAAGEPGAQQWRGHSPASARLVERRATIAEDLRTRHVQEHLVLHYQPQVDVGDGRPIGFEALVRWDHPTLGLLAPDEFIPQVERAGLMGWLTTVVLDRALGDHATLAESFPGCSVSVNISARNLLGRGLEAEVASLLERHGVPASALTLEVSEPPTSASAVLTETLAGLERLGCRVSVSEFGTGSCSLLALSQHGAISELKLGAALVTDILGDTTAERLVRAVIGTAHALDVRVVAEGVESANIGALMRELGCDVLQGFHVRAPGTLDDVSRWAPTWPVELEHRDDAPRTVSAGAG